MFGMLMAAYENFRWEGALASDWRWPAAGVLVYLALVFVLGFAMKNATLAGYHHVSGCFTQELSC